MAEEVVNSKVEELEERLSKATAVYKAQKVELEKTKVELEKALERIKFLENMPEDKVQSNEILLERIKELEDEITINGNSGEEIKALNERLDKAKKVFAEQKTKIAELKAVNEEQEKNVLEMDNALKASQKECDTLHNDYGVRCKELNDCKTQLETTLKALNTIKETIQHLV